MIFRNLDDVETALLDRSDLSVRDLHSIWEQRQPVPDPTKRKAGGTASAGQQIAWLQADISLARRFTHRALEKEEFLLVCDAAEEVLRLPLVEIQSAAGDLVAVRMDYASALTRMGSTRRAMGILEPCLDADSGLGIGRRRRVDVLLQMGSILREESLYAAATASRRQTTEDALCYYQQALTLEPNRFEAQYLTAAVSLVLNEPDGAMREQAHRHAREALRLIDQLDETAAHTARICRGRAVAHSVLGETDRAAASYSEMAKCEGVSIKELADARYYARFLAEALGLESDYFKRAFPKLQLIVFAGHLPDLPGAPVRFPFSSVDDVRARIRARLEEMNARVGLVSAAAGADLLFVEALRERGGTVHMLLPWSRDEFRRTSVLPYEPPGQPPYWGPIFDRELEHAATLREIGQAYGTGSEVGWKYLGEVCAGLALNIARTSRLDVQPLVLWDKLPGRGAGGTSAFADFWTHELGQEPEYIPLPDEATPRTGAGYGGTRMHSERSECSTFRQEVKSILFADIVGYSKLSEAAIREFINLFLEKVSQLTASSKHAPRHINTWGDAIYGVFDFAHDAGCFALELTQMIQEGEALWLKSGLYWEEVIDGGHETRKRPLNIRVGLHTGPVFMHYNPVVRQLGFTGVHVSRAARIEPVTVPGEVFASEEFAALSVLGGAIQGPSRAAGGASDDHAGFACEYVGSMPLAKGYPGRHRIYRVLPKRVFALDELARAVHEFYRFEAEANGDTPETNPALVPWEKLPEDLREANLAQAADIPNKLRALGFELAPGPGLSPFEIQISDAKMDELSIREHDRWMKERLRQGWTYGAVRDNARKHHPMIVPWDDLTVEEKDKDRDAVRNLPKLIEKARFRVRKVGRAK